MSAWGLNDALELDRRADFQLNFSLPPSISSTVPLLSAISHSSLPYIIHSAVHTTLFLLSPGALVLALSFLYPSFTFSLPSLPFLTLSVYTVYLSLSLSFSISPSHPPLSLCVTAVQGGSLINSSVSPAA